MGKGKKEIQYPKSQLLVGGACRSPGHGPLPATTDSNSCVPNVKREERDSVFEIRRLLILAFVDFCANLSTLPDWRFDTVRAYGTKKLWRHLFACFLVSRIPLLSGYLPTGQEISVGDPRSESDTLVWKIKYTALVYVDRRVNKNVDLTAKMMVGGSCRSPTHSLLSPTTDPN